MVAPRSRRALVSLGAVLVLSTGMLSGCGFGRATDRPYTPAWGANEQAEDVSALAMQIVASEDGTGVLIGTISNHSAEQSVKLTQIDSVDVQVTIDSPLEAKPRGVLNLADDGGLPVTGDFKITDSDYATMTLNFDGAQPLELDVPIVPAEGDFADFGGSSDSASPSGDTSESPSESASSSESASPSESASSSEGN